MKLVEVECEKGAKGEGCGACQCPLAHSAQRWHSMLTQRCCQTSGCLFRQGERV